VIGSSEGQGMRVQRQLQPPTLLFTRSAVQCSHAQGCQAVPRLLAWRGCLNCLGTRAAHAAGSPPVWGVSRPVRACALAGAAGAGGQDHLPGRRQRVQARAAGGQPQPGRQHGPGAPVGLCCQHSCLLLLRPGWRVLEGQSGRLWQVPVGWRVPVDGRAKSSCMPLTAPCRSVNQVGTVGDAFTAAPCSAS